MRFDGFLREKQSLGDLAIGELLGDQLGNLKLAATEGVELATAYSELVDPVVQRERLVAQSLLAAGGDPEAMQLDEDFLRAMEYGMPPAGGMGMGIDRLLMAFTGLGIRETILFPLVRPE